MWAPSWQTWSWSAFMATKPSCWSTGRTRWKVSVCSKRTAVRLVFTAPSIMGCVTSFCKDWLWSPKTFAASLYSGKDVNYATVNLWNISFSCPSTSQPCLTWKVWCLPYFVSLRSRLITRQLAKYHAIHAHNGWVPQSDLWLKLSKYFALIPKYFKDPEQNAR